MKIYLVLLKIVSSSYLIFCTIDLTLPEFQYIANHLTKDECHKLIASLHFDSFELSRNVEIAENAIPEDIGCLKLLLHWNASPNEGLGTTHEKVSLRLRQMGRRELADWLDKAVLQELEGEIYNVAEEFKGNQDNEETSNVYDEDLEEQFIIDFSRMDLLMVIIGMVSVCLMSFTLLLLGYKAYDQYRVSKMDTRSIVEENYKNRVRGSILVKRVSLLQHANLGDTLLSNM